MNLHSKLPYLLVSIYSENSLLDYSEVGDWINDFENTLKTEWRVHPEVEENYNKQKAQFVQLAKQNNLTDEVSTSMIKETSLIIISKAPRKWELVERLRKIDVIMYNIWRKSKAFDSDQFKNEVQSFLKFYDGNK